MYFHTNTIYGKLQFLVNIYYSYIVYNFYFLIAISHASN